MIQFLRKLVFRPKVFMMLANVFGSRVFDFTWRFRDVQDVRDGFSNIDKPHRKWITEQVASSGGVTSICELGSGYGPNLEILSRQLPEAKLLGLDIAPASVNAGNERFRAMGIKNVQLKIARAPHLEMLADKSFEVVLTDACLLYLDQAMFEATVLELARIAQKCLFILELNDSGLENRSVLTSDGYLRDYEYQLRKILPATNIRSIAPPSELWTSGRWPRYGKLFIVSVFPE